jgi:Flp pilus assembly protein TadD
MRKGRAAWSPGKRRALTWGVVSVVALSLFAGSAWSYYRTARSQWLTAAETSQLLAEVKRFPDDAELLYVSARRLWERDGKPAAAEPLAYRALELAPRDPKIHLLLGFLGIQNHRPAEALYHFEKACEIDPTLRHAHSGAGGIYVDVGLPDAAIPHLEQAWDPKVPQVPVRTSLVEALYQKGDFADAERLCREAMPYAPKGAVLPYQQLYKIAKRTGRAAQIKEEMYARYRSDGTILTAPFFTELALVVLDLDRSQKAVAEAEVFARRAEKISREDRPALEVRGAILARQGRHEEAVAKLRQAVAMDPKPRRTRAMLAASLRALGRDKEAARWAPPPRSVPEPPSVADLRKRLEAAPGDAALRLSVAEAQERAGDPRGAFLTCWPLMQRDINDTRVVKLANRALEQALRDPLTDSFPG